MQPATDEDEAWPLRRRQLMKTLLAFMQLATDEDEVWPLRSRQLMKTPLAFTQPATDDAAGLYAASN